MSISKNKTSKKKEEIKTAQAYNCNLTIIYEGWACCPYCGLDNFVYGQDYKPTLIKCTSGDCNKQFNIEWE